MSYVIIQSIGHAPEHRGPDRREIQSVEVFMDYDPILPCWPPEGGWIALPGVWSDRHPEQVQQLPET